MEEESKNPIQVAEKLFRVIDVPIARLAAAQAAIAKKNA